VATLTGLYTNIGRGHPFYLDGTLAEFSRLAREPAQISTADVFGVSSFVPRQLWRLMRALYVRGSSPGVASVVYRRLRAHGDFSRPGVALKLAGSSIRARYGGGEGAVIVAHPLLVAVLRGRPRLFYQHGEVVTPAQATVPGAEVVFVPTGEAAQPFLAAGYAREQLVVTGLCVEPELVPLAPRCYQERMNRLGGERSLVGAFFSSGAEPRPHTGQLAAAACSAARRGGVAVVFARAGGRLAAEIRRGSARAGVRIDSTAVEAAISLVEFDSRAALDREVARCFPRFDYLAAPPHERTHWGLGLGLPMFLAGPDVGPFAPLNRTRLEAAGVARALASGRDAQSFGADLESLRDGGTLRAMAEAGFGRHPIDGFARSAEFLMRRLQIRALDV
jgi:hypothetical protein